MSAVDRSKVERPCRNCDGVGWVCEDHPDQPWAGLADWPACCGGAGAPCPVCQPELAAAPYVEAALRRISA